LHKKLEHSQGEKKLIKNYDNISFNDEFEPEDEMCEVCGCDEMPRVGYNEKEDLLKFECPNCGAVFIADEEYKFTMVKGERRDWLEYLAANVKFPFKAVVSE
jgi:predicted RNA-binding Zn-ribbon protein involved in translation (DUF1610 family)